MKDVLKDFNDKLNLSLEPRGFTEFSFSKGAINYYKSEEYRSLLFGFGYNYYHDSVVLSHFGCAISFYSIEDILTPFLIKYKLVGELYGKSQVATLRDNSSSSLFNSKRIELKGVEDNSDILQNIIKLIDEECIPFFNKMQTLKEVSYYIEELDFLQLRNKLGTGAIFKKMLILHFAGHNKREQYIDLLGQQIKQEASENPQDDIYSRYQDIYSELLKVIHPNHA